MLAPKIHSIKNRFPRPNVLISNLIILLVVFVLLMGININCSKHQITENPADTLTALKPSTQIFSEILGRPTNSSVTMSVLFGQTNDVYFEYGTTSGNYTLKSSKLTTTTGIPLQTDLSNLTTNTKYYYRTRYQINGTTSAFFAGSEHSFRTSRASGDTFTFAVEADPHLDVNSDTSAYKLTLQNILAANPDFMLDLGDTFMSEKQTDVNQTVITNRHLLYRPLFGSVCHSVPLYLAIGNHEGELGWMLNGTNSSLPVMTSNTRKLYYPNPEPNSFYSGNSKSENFVGLRQNYYSWQWGNALFVVLDPYWNTTNKPGWGWTLGADQYNWFKSVITGSSTKYKFVFCHQLVGGNGNDARGGTEFAQLFEMGGNNTDGSYGFDAYRPGWQKPIHTLMKESKTTIFFHGHDHFYGKQEKDGIIYQEVPQPSNKNISKTSAADYGYVNGVILAGRGYLLVTVSDSNVKVEYIKTLLTVEENGTDKNRVIGDSYLIN